GAHHAGRVQRADAAPFQARAGFALRFGDPAQPVVEVGGCDQHGGTIARGGIDPLHRLAERRAPDRRLQDDSQVAALRGGARALAQRCDLGLLRAHELHLGAQPRQRSREPLTGRETRLPHEQVQRDQRDRDRAAGEQRALARCSLAPEFAQTPRIHFDPGTAAISRRAPPAPSSTRISRPGALALARSCAASAAALLGSRARSESETRTFSWSIASTPCAPGSGIDSATALRSATKSEALPCPAATRSSVSARLICRGGSTSTALSPKLCR